MKRVSISEAIWALELLPRILPSAEPIGPIRPKGLKALESALHAPFISYAGKYKYWYLYHRAAVMFYRIAKDHTIGNGNKRCAVIVTMVFLIKNDKMLAFTPSDMYKIANMVASSNPRKSEEMIEILRDSFRQNTIDLPRELS